MARKKRLDTGMVLNTNSSSILSGIGGEIQKIPTAAYVRLSSDDADTSGSLINQQNLLIQHIQNDKELELYKIYADNGFTGTDFNRPAFMRMMHDMKKGLVKCIIVKDLSRLGRNYLETGKYLEKILPLYNVRFISVGDGYDSFSVSGSCESLIIPLKNIIHEGYAKDISVKVSTAIDVCKKQGKFMGKHPPYGYIRDPNDKYKLIIDKEAAEVVLKIFRMRLGGMSFSDIAKFLNSEGILSPACYFYSKGVSNELKYKNSSWNTNNVRRLTENYIYTGDLVYGKVKSSLQLGIKRKSIPRDKWKKVENTHEAIIDKFLFDAVQRKNSGTIISNKLNHEEVESL